MCVWKYTITITRHLDQDEQGKYQGLRPRNTLSVIVGLQCQKPPEDTQLHQNYQFDNILDIPDHPEVDQEA